MHAPNDNCSLVQLQYFWNITNPGEARCGVRHADHARPLQRRGGLLFLPRVVSPHSPRFRAAAM